MQIRLLACLQHGWDAVNCHTDIAGFLFILSRVFNRLLPENNWEWILLLSWAGLLRRTVYCPCHRIESSAYPMCDVRQWLWMPVASHQPLSSLDILLSSAVSSIHPSSSGCNHPSENSTCVESRGYAAVQRQTREEITYHSQLCDCWILPVCFLKGSLQTLSLFRSIFPSEHKTKMRSHCLVIISQGCSPLSATELCLICLGRC